MTGKEVRIVFMGTPEFAVTSLDELVSKGYNVVGVVTAPDKPSGRGMQLAESAVGKYASLKGIRVLKPDKLKDQGFISELKSMQPDLQVVVAFRMLPEVVWNLPPLGTFNLHASLLPQYRGAAPINWAIINDEKETGVTTFLLDHQIDTGKIILSRKTAIGESETAGNLHDRLMEMGAELVLETVEFIASGKGEFVDQKRFDSQELKHAPKIFRDDCRINWSQKAASIRNLVRGLSPYPAAWTLLKHRDTGAESLLKIYFTEIQAEKHPFNPGKILSDNRTFLNIACSDGWLTITNLQLEGKKRMATNEFLRGFHRIEDYSAI